MEQQFSHDNNNMYHLYQTTPIWLAFQH